MPLRIVPSVVLMCVRWIGQIVASVAAAAEILLRLKHRVCAPPAYHDTVLHAALGLSPSGLSPFEATEDSYPQEPASVALARLRY